MVQKSDELYLLSEESDASVKVRDDLMDVKRLEAVDGNGLEQWRPVLKASFPLAAADVAAVLDALGVAGPELARDAYTLEQLVAELVRPDPALTDVAVHKQRVHYEFAGCMAELSEVTAAHRSTRTIAVEAEDPALVIAAVRELQLADRPNVCLARGLKTMLGLDPVRFAVIDVGTNSVKLHVGERHAGRRLAHDPRPRRGDQARPGAAGDAARCSRSRCSGPPTRSSAWSRSRAPPASPRSPRSRPPGCARPRTPPS